MDFSSRGRETERRRSDGAVVGSPSPRVSLTGVLTRVKTPSQAGLRQKTEPMPQGPQFCVWVGFAWFRF